MLPIHENSIKKYIGKEVTLILKNGDKIAGTVTNGTKDEADSYVWIDGSSFPMGSVEHVITPPFKLPDWTNKIHPTTIEAALRFAGQKVLVTRHDHTTVTGLFHIVSDANLGIGAAMVPLEDIESMELADQVENPAN